MHVFTLLLFVCDTSDTFTVDTQLHMCFTIATDYPATVTHTCSHVTSPLPSSPCLCRCLQRFVQVHLQSVLHVSSSWSVPSHRLWVGGRLGLRQTLPLPNTGTIDTYNVSTGSGAHQPALLHPMGLHTTTTGMALGGTVCCLCDKNIHLTIVLALMCPPLLSEIQALSVCVSVGTTC